MAIEVESVVLRTIISAISGSVSTRDFSRSCCHIRMDHLQFSGGRELTSRWDLVRA